MFCFLTYVVIVIMMLTGSGVEIKWYVALFLSYMTDTSLKAMSENTHCPAAVCDRIEIQKRGKY